VAAFSGLTVAGWLYGRINLSKLAAVFAAFELLMGVQALLVSSEKGRLDLPLENLLLAALTMAVAFTGLAFRQAGWNGTVVIATGVLALLTRWSQLLFPQIGIGLSPATLSWVAYAVILLIAGFVWRSATLRSCSLALMLLTVGRILFLDLSSTSVAAKVGVLLLLGLLMLIGGYAYIKALRNPQTTIPS
jgi:hypothetical protein